MIESFNHYTLNTGDSRRSHPREVDKNMYLVLKGFIRDSQSAALMCVLSSKR